MRIRGSPQRKPRLGARLRWLALGAIASLLGSTTMASVDNAPAGAQALMQRVQSVRHNLDAVRDSVRFLDAEGGVVAQWRNWNNWNNWVNWNNWNNWWNGR